MHDDDHHNSGRLFAPTRLVAPIMSSRGSLVYVKPEHRTDRPDSEGGKAFVLNADGGETQRYNVRYVIDKSSLTERQIIPYSTNNS